MEASSPPIIPNLYLKWTILLFMWNKQFTYVQFYEEYKSEINQCLSISLQINLSMPAGISNRPALLSQYLKCCVTRTRIVIVTIRRIKCFVENKILKLVYFLHRLNLQTEAVSVCGFEVRPLKQRCKKSISTKNFSFTYKEINLHVPVLNRHGKWVSSSIVLSAP